MLRQNTVCANDDRGLVGGARSGASGGGPRQKVARCPDPVPLQEFHHDDGRSYGEVGRIETRNGLRGSARLQILGLPLTCPSFHRLRVFGWRADLPLQQQKRLAGTLRMGDPNRVRDDGEIHRDLDGCRGDARTYASVNPPARVRGERSRRSCLTQRLAFLLPGHASALTWRRQAAGQAPSSWTAKRGASMGARSTFTQAHKGQMAALLLRARSLWSPRSPLPPRESPRPRDAGRWFRASTRPGAPRAQPRRHRTRTGRPA